MLKLAVKLPPFSLSERLSNNLSCRIDFIELAPQVAFQLLKIRIHCEIRGEQHHFVRAVINRHNADRGGIRQKTMIYAPATIAGMAHFSREINQCLVILERRKVNHLDQVAVQFHQVNICSFIVVSKPLPFGATSQKSSINYRSDSADGLRPRSVLLPIAATILPNKTRFHDASLLMGRRPQGRLNLASMISMMSDLTAVKSTSTEIAVSQFGHTKARQFHFVPLDAIPAIGRMLIVTKDLLQCGQSAMSFSLRLLRKLDIALENSGKQIRTNEATA